MNYCKTIGRYLLIAAFVTIAACKSANADLVINEIFINPPGTDNGLEFIELRSTTGGVESMAGLTLIGIEGDGAAAGVIDFALNLGSFSTGTNGLFLWRDSATVLTPAPAAATTINVADFSPDIENGSQTFLLVTNFTGVVTQDLDTNNDGVLDATPWASVRDGIGLIENDGAANVAYAQALGFMNYTNAGFNADVLFRDGTTGAWLATDVLGTSPGPFTADPAIGRSSWGANGSEAISPGNFNASISAVPEPSSLALLGVASLLGMCFRKRA